MRVYLPATLATLARLREQGELPPARAHAVTPSLREWYADADAEELAYAAYVNAARESLRLLHADPAAPRRRVVVAADVPGDVPAEPDQELGSSAVSVPEPVRRGAVVAIHVDGAGAERAVATAAQALPAADAGDPDAGLAVGDAEDHELEWYDSSELDQLLE